MTCITKIDPWGIFTQQKKNQDSKKCKKKLATDISVVNRKNKTEKDFQLKRPGGKLHKIRILPN